MITMQESARNNPLGSESIPKLIARFSVPAIISMLVNALYNIVDQIFIGQGIGTNGIAATNIAFPLVTICTALALLLGIGAASNFSLLLGKKEPERASYVIGNALTAMLICSGVLLVLAMVFLEPMLVFFGATADVMVYARPYTLITNIGIPFLIFTTGGCHIIRADGDPRFSMICLVSGATFNFIFDPVFMFVFDMGIEGIALATTLSQVLTAVLAGFYMLRKFKSVPLRKQHLRLRLDYIRMLCTLGAASFFNQIAMTVVQISLNNTLRHYGALSIYGSEIPLACVGVVSKLNVVFISITIGIAQGCQPIIGYNYGAKQYARVRKTYLYALFLASITSVLAFLAFQLFPRQIISIFGTGSDLYFEFAIQYLRVFMIMTFINGIQPVTATFFTSIGKARLGIFMSLTRQVLVLLPLILILPLFMGIDGIMYTGPIADVAAVTLAIVFALRELKLLKGPELPGASAMGKAA